MKNSFGKLNNVIKSMSTVHDIYHHVLQTPTLKSEYEEGISPF